jgi:hypothetical protein
MPIQFLIGILILVLATCSIYSPTPRGSGIEGQVLLGPMCPAEQQGPGCPNQPYQATLTVNSRNGTQITRFQTDEQGNFQIPLVPGQYILHPESSNGPPFARDVSFVVETGRYTRLTVYYDSLIQ